MNGLFIDSLITIRYSHEAWARVMSVEKKASIQSNSTSKTTAFGLPMVTYAKRQRFDVSGLKNPNPVQGGAAAACVCGEPSLS